MYLNLNKVKKIIVKPSVSIYDVIKNLSDSGLRIVLVEDNKKNFFGVINDGDIRRAFLRGSGLNSSIQNIINKKAVFINYKSINDIKTKNNIQKFNEPIPVIKDSKIFGLITARKMRTNKFDKAPHSNVGVVIMAGGIGSRLRPLTFKKPKPLLRYKSKTLIEYVLDNAKNYGFNNFFISVFYLKNQLKKFFKSKNFSKQKINILDEKKPMGTIGSLSLLKNISKNFIVLNCDVISDVNLKELYNSHLKSKCIMTLTIKKIRFQNPYGTIISKGKKLLSIKEKPDLNFDINAGLYVFNKKIINIIKKKRIKKIDELIHYLVEKKQKINIFHMVENWKDFGQDVQTLKKYN